jgi:hypothetical protein
MDVWLVVRMSGESYELLWQVLHRPTHAAKHRCSRAKRSSTTGLRVAVLMP